MSDELKPCPFCGGIEIDPMFNPQCESCGAKAATVAQWNARPIEDALRKELEEAKAREERLEIAIEEHIGRAYCENDDSGFNESCKQDCHNYGICLSLSNHDLRVSFSKLAEGSESK